ncbi:MAG: hypothetical protein DRP91_05375 [Candidatus Neomarinimicrobiota bacterium]|nr:MAG: hypothetical protein DRP91_05375 [Candidatus Neomarinimicrobiota bacterium]
MVFLPGRFSRRGERSELVGKRFRFKRLRHNTKRMTRPLWWLIVMALIVLAIIYYLNRIMK